jgi:hypothetical protein
LEFGIWGGGADLGVEFAAVPAGIGVEFVVVGASAQKVSLRMKPEGESVDILPKEMLTASP